MSRYFLTCLILCFCLMSIVVQAEETDYEKAEREAAEYKMNQIKGKAAQLDVDIQFYGRVIDQYGNPVESADVFLHVTRFSPVMELLFGETVKVQLTTDTQGCFAFTGEKGRRIYLDEFKKEGYEFSLSQNLKLGYDYTGLEESFISDQNNPVVFHMRKIGEAAFLIWKKDVKLCFHIEESGIKIGIDLVRRIKIDDLSNPMFNGERLVCDLKMTATFNANNKAWVVALSPGDADGGILASEQLLYEAPQEGFQSEYFFTAEDRNQPVKKYLYLKGRNPAIYSRVEIEDVCTDDTYLCLYGQSVTNPYSDRNLEQATDLPYAVDKQLSDEVESAYRQNKRPVKPDLQKLINEAK